MVIVVHRGRLEIRFVVKYIAVTMKDILGAVSKMAGRCLSL